MPNSQESFPGAAHVGLWHQTVNPFLPWATSAMRRCTPLGFSTSALLTLGEGEHGLLQGRISSSPLSPMTFKTAPQRQMYPRQAKRGSNAPAENPCSGQATPGALYPPNTPGTRRPGSAAEKARAVRAGVSTSLATQDSSPDAGCPSPQAAMQQGYLYLCRGW